MELFCRDGGVNVYPVLRQVCGTTDCHVLTLGKCGPNHRETRNPKYHTNWTPAHASGALWNSEKKGPFFQVPARCREEGWSLDSPSLLFKGNDYIKKCWERSMCDSVFKERSNVDAKYQRRNIPFLSKTPITTSLHVPQIYKNWFSKAMLIVPGTAEIRSGLHWKSAFYKTISGTESPKLNRNVFVLLFHTTDCLNWEHEWERIPLHILHTYIKRPQTHLVLEIITSSPKILL